MQPHSHVVSQVWNGMKGVRIGFVPCTSPDGLKGIRFKTGLNALLADVLRAPVSPTESESWFDQH